MTGTVAAIGEVIGSAGLVSLLLGWFLPWGSRRRTWDMWGSTSNPESGHVLALLAVLTGGYMLAITFAAPATFSAGPVRRWIRKKPAARSEQAFPAIQIIFIAWGVGCAIWADRVLAVQYVPRWGGFAVYFAGIALALAAATFWLAENKLLVRLRWAATIVVVGVVCAVLAGQGIGWLTRHVVTHTTAAVTIIESPPSMLSGVAWERPLAAGEVLAGNAGGRIILSTTRRTSAGCVEGVIALDAATGQEAWRFLTLTDEVDCADGALPPEVLGNDRVIQISMRLGDNLYFNPVTGEQLSPRVQLDYPKYLGDLVIDDLWLPRSGGITVISPVSGELIRSLQVPRCADGEPADAQLGEFPGPADVLSGGYAQVGASAEFLTLPIACSVLYQTTQRDLGLWVVNLRGSSLDRVVWVVRASTFGITDLPFVIDFSPPLIFGTTAIFSADYLRGDEPEKIMPPDHTMTFAIDLRTGEGLWAHTDLPVQTPLQIGEHGLLFPKGLDSSIAAGDAEKADLNSGDIFPAAVDAATGAQTGEWASVSDADLAWGGSRPATIADGKAYYGSTQETGAGVQVTDLVTGETLSRVSLDAPCDNPGFAGETVGLAGETVYCVVDFDQPTRRIVGIR